MNPTARERAEAGPKKCECIGNPPLCKLDDLGLRCQRCGGDVLRRYPERIRGRLLAIARSQMYRED